MEAASAGASSQQQLPMPPPPTGTVGGAPPPSAGRSKQQGGGRGRTNSNNGGRGNNNGRGGGRTGRGGRTGTGGRTIHDVNHNSGRGGGRGGRGRGAPGQHSNNNQQETKIAPKTGIPFGHVPAYLPGSSSLVEELDQRIMVVLRDGRHLVGNLRTFDQYSNMVLDQASERRFHKSENDDNTNDNNKKITYFADYPLGMYIVRGDSVVLLGQIGSEENETTESGHVVMERLDEEDFEALVDNDGDDDDDDDNSSGEGSQALEWDFDKDLLA
uniref:U6 snRNA-associated Sm-like protein LSm1 n=1 Tax=Pseudo-nitzschia australis TaxID=44445 RepID=A0A6U9YY02_9STRA|mmetsp:Transcript_27009/g.59391  ORF Transcript_27009/g.59391 Transcript_27009/m.59391 type:complete len:271 (-) Transcript_27009:338-1150(-)